MARGVQREKILMEDLERRCLLSAAASDAQALLADGFKSMRWHGQPIYARSDQWLLKLSDVDGAPQKQVKLVTKKLRRLGGGAVPLRQLGEDGLVLIRASGSFGKLQKLMKRLGGFEYLEPDLRVHLSDTTPNDPEFANQWDLLNTATPGADIDATQAWDITTGDPNQIVADIDTGINLQHPDLVGNLWTNPGEIPGNGIDDDHNGYIDDVHGWDFVSNDNTPNDEHGHGTHTAGTLAAVGNNGMGVTGVAWDVSLLPLKFIGGDGNGSTSDAVAAINYCTDLRRRGFNIRVSNNSWGADGGYSQSLYDAIKANGEAGMLFVTAAGNEGVNIDAQADQSLFYPAAFDLPNIISVASTDSSDRRSSFSNWGSTSVDLGAPGTLIRSTTSDGGYGYMSGTSMASPHVAGVAALAFAISPPNTDIQTIKSAIFNGSDSIASMQDITVTGKRLNAFGTLMQLPLNVLSATPGDGQVISDLPRDFMLHFSHPLDGGSVDASDLTVNGIAADSVAILGTEDLQFHFNASPVAAQGLEQMAMAAGAVQRSDGLGVQAFADSFRYDAVVMHVDSTVPSGMAQPPLTAIDVHLNEAVDPASVDAGDLRLSRGSVTGATVLDPQTIRFLVGGLDSEANITIQMPAGALTDAFGNPSAGYFGALELDVNTVAYPAWPAGALTSLDPPAPMAGMVNDPTDVDQFTVSLKAGENISILVSADDPLQPSVEIRDPAGAFVTGATGAAGQAVTLSAAAASSGTYTIRVGSAAGTMGSYTLEAALEARLEDELSGGTNDDQDHAQSLDGDFAGLPLGGSRAAVVGRIDGFSGALASEVEPNDSTAQANSGRLNFFASGTNQYQIGLNAQIDDGDSADFYDIGTLQVGDVLTVSMAGQDSERGGLIDPYLEVYRFNGGSPIPVAVDDDSGVGTDSLVYQLSIDTADQYFVVARPFDSGETGTYQLGLTLTAQGAAPATGQEGADLEPNGDFANASSLASAWKAVGFRSTTAASLTAGDIDYYSYDLTAGDVLTIKPDALASGLGLWVALVDSNGNTIALDDGSSAGLDGLSPIYCFPIATSGSYFVEVMASQGTGDYQLELDLSGTAPPAAPVPPDWYSVSLAAGDRLTLAMSNPGSGAMNLDLVDSGGSVIASGVSAEDGTELRLEDFAATADGTYFIRVLGPELVDYKLLALRNAGLEAEPDDSMATARPLGASGRLLGQGEGEDWYSINASAGDTVQVATATLDGGFDPQIEVYDPGGALLASGDPSVATFLATASGTYFVHVGGVEGGEYELTATNFTAGLVGTGGNDAWVVRGSGGNVEIYLNDASVPRYVVPASALGSVQLSGGLGDDSLQVDFATVADALNIVFDGGEGLDRLLLMGDAGDDAVTFGTTQITARSVAISTDLVEAEEFEGGAGENVLNVTGGSHNLDEDLGAGSAHVAVNVLGGTLRVGAGQQWSGLTIAAGGVVDMLSNDLVLDYSGPSPLGSLQQYARDGRLVTSVGDDSSFSPFQRTLAIWDNAQTKFQSFNGVVLPDFNQVLVKYTYFGDANLDGQVTPSDYAIVDGNVGLGHDWAGGDLDGDGQVTPADYAQIDGNMGAGSGGMAGPGL